MNDLKEIRIDIFDYYFDNYNWKDGYLLFEYFINRYPKEKYKKKIISKYYLYYNDIKAKKNFDKNYLNDVLNFIKNIDGYIHVPYDTALSFSKLKHKIIYNIKLVINKNNN